MTNREFAYKMENDKEFSKFISDMYDLQKARGYIIPKNNSLKIFLHNIQVFLSFIVLITGIYELCNYYEDVSLRKTIFVGIVIYVFCIYKLITKSYAKSNGKVDKVDRKEDEDI